MSVSVNCPCSLHILHNNISINYDLNLGHFVLYIISTSSPAFIYKMLFVSGEHQQSSLSSLVLMSLVSGCLEGTSSLSMCVCVSVGIPSDDETGGSPGK